MKIYKNNYYTNSKIASRYKLIILLIKKKNWFGYANKKETEEEIKDIKERNLQILKCDIYIYIYMLLAHCA